VSFTLACVMVRGKRRHYFPKYVERLREMVRRHTDRAFRTVCLTDQTKAMPEGVIPVRVPRVPADERGWWRKMCLFHPNMPFKGRVLYLDLDVLVVNDINPILDFPADFAIAPGSAPTVQPPGKLKMVRGYQSSVMVWDHRARTRFHKDFDPLMKRRLYGDQDALKEMSPDEATLPPEWFGLVRPNGPESWTTETKVVLCMRYKNHRAIKKFPWFRDYWILNSAPQ
jgi:hypothetical protein